MPVGPPRKTERIQYFMDFLCLYVEGIDCAKKLKTKINLIELYPTIHAEIKLLHFSIMKGRHAEKKKIKKKIKRTLLLPLLQPGISQAEVVKEDSAVLKE